MEASVEPMQIVLVVLALVGVWAVAELALTLRRTRDVVASLDKTVDQVNSTIEEARPVVAKLDGVVDELQPAVAQVEPLLKQATVTVEALSADLIEVNGVLRDVSAVSGAASSASNAVTEFADAASGKVQRLLNRGHKAVAPKVVRPVSAHDAEPCAAPAPESAEAPESEPEAESQAEPRTYFTYNPGEETIDD